MGDTPTEVFVQTWASGHLANDIATSLTCIEAEALAGLLRDLGQPDAADEWIEAHAQGDECGDMHCTCSDPRCIEERAGGGAGG